MNTKDPWEILNRSRLLFAREKVDAAVDAMAVEINKVYGREPLILVAVLTGGMQTMAWLASRLEMPLKMDFVHATRYRGGLYGAELEYRVPPRLDLEGKNILIRDDMVDTGGSICQAADYLKDRGALDIYAACTHGVLSGPAVERIEKTEIKKMVISASIDQSRQKLPKKFEFITCSELIGEAIKRIFDEHSVSSLFEETTNEN